MNYENQDIEINLKSIFFSALYQWKKLLVLGLVFALLLGTFRGYKDFSLLSDPEVSAKLKDNYEKEVAYYQSKLEELEKNVDTLKTNRENQIDYLAKSVLMQIDPNHVAEASATVYIKTDYQIIPDATYQNPDKTATLLHAYKSIILGDSLLDNITKETGLETKYVKELVSLPVPESDEMAAAPASNTIDIKVIHQDTAAAENMLQIILNYIDNTKQVLAKDIENHELHVISKNVGVRVDTELATTQNDAKKQLSTIEQNLLSTETTLANMAAPEKAVLSVSDAIVSILTWAVIGAVVGIILGGVWYSFCFLISGKLYSDDELKARFHVRILGTLLRSDKKPDPLTSFLRKKEGRITSNTDANLAVIAASIDGYCNHEGTLLLTGDLDKAVIEALGKKLADKLPQVKVISCGSLLQDADAVNNLMTCDHVLTIAQCNVSAYNNIKEELKRIQDFKKDHIGYIVME